MAGYSGISMSNNAVEAYNRGLLTASKIRKNLPADLIVKYCRSEEWHHASPHFNEVSFYNPDYVKATFGIIQHDKYPPIEKAIIEWANYKKEKKEESMKQKLSEPETFFPCQVNWSTTNMKGKRFDHEKHGCTVLVKGNWCFITLPDGKQMKKGINTKHFTFEVVEAPPDQNANP